MAVTRQRFIYYGLGLLLAVALTIMFYRIDGFTLMPLMFWLAQVLLDVVPPMIRRLREQPRSDR